MSTAAHSSTQAAPSSSTSSSSRDDHTFSPTSSPPLILAFLAIGLFSASMIAVFGWKRIQFHREVTMRRAGNAGSRRAELYGSSERPELWDLWSDRLQLGRKVAMEGDNVLWENMMPISVTKLPEVTSPQDDKFTLLSRQHSSPLMNFTHAPTSLLRPKRKNDIGIEHGKNGSRHVRTHLQVAFAIAMPTPRHSITNLIRDEGMQRNVEKNNETIDYSIGLYHCPWYEGG